MTVVERFWAVLIALAIAVLKRYIRVKERWQAWRDRPYVTSYGTSKGRRSLRFVIDHNAYTIEWKVPMGPLRSCFWYGEKDGFEEDVTLMVRALAGPDQNFFGRLVTPKMCGYNRMKRIHSADGESEWFERERTLCF